MKINALLLKDFYKVKSIVITMPAKLGSYDAFSIQSIKTASPSGKE